MLSRSLTPLRRTVGQPIHIARATLGTRSVELQQAEITLTMNVHQSLDNVVSLNYRDVLPDTIMPGGPSGPALEPAAGSDVFTEPADLPFETHDASFLFLQALSKGRATGVSRSLWFEVVVWFEREVLLGGICYGGYPFLPYYVTAQGENSSNFGLPREIRLRWKGSDADFIDDETAITIQEPTSHSGVHYLCTGPVKTNQVRLYFSDLSKFLQSITIDKNGVVEFKEKYGMLIPYLYFFAYQEGTRFEPHVPAGLLATMRGQTIGGSPVQSEFRASADFFFKEGNTLAHMSGASMFAGRRTYRESSRPVHECFCSFQLNPNDALRIYVEQAEEQTRCIAGLRLKFCVPRFEGVLRRTETRLKVYEVDPPEGVSPLNVITPENKKYRTVLFDAGVTRAQDTLVCKFVRPSSSRYFVLVFTNSSSEPCQVAIENAELVQSVHVSVVPRPSRAQTISNLHYRIIGPGMADDYALLGPEGFSFTVERLVAGERKSVLFSAASLLDLLHGGARLYANQRYLANTDYEEQVKTLPGGFDEHLTRAWSDGWRRSESGEGVSWNDPSVVTNEHNPVSNHGFTNFSNSEIRNYVELIGHEGALEVLDDLRKLINTIVGRDLLKPLEGDPRLLQSDGSLLSWKEKVWKGISGVGPIGAVSNVTIPPLFLVPEESMAGLEKAIREIADWLKGPPGSLPAGPTPAGPPFNELIAMLFPAAPHRLTLNGLGIGLSVGASWVVGGSLSLSCAQVLPQLMYNSSAGTTGNITKQASLSGYSYNQVLNKSFDTAHVKNELLGGSVTRQISRREQRNEANKSRARGVEVKWQDKFVDILTGTIPIGITLPATANQSHRTADETLLVRLGSSVGKSVWVDIWFDVIEEVVRDDY